MEKIGTLEALASDNILINGIIQATVQHCKNLVSTCHLAYYHEALVDSHNDHGVGNNSA